MTRMAKNCAVRARRPPNCATSRAVPTNSARAKNWTGLPPRRAARRLSAERAQGRAEPPHSNAQEPERAYGGSYSRVDTGAGPSRRRCAKGAPRVDGAAREDDAYVRPSERSRYGARSQTGREYDGDATRRLTYDSPRSNYGRDGEYAAERAQSQPAQPVQPASPRRRPLPKPIEAVVNSLGLDGVLLNAGLVDGSFLRYVLERRIIFAAWRRGWINKRTRAYVADASVSQAHDGRTATGRRQDRRTAHSRLSQRCAPRSEDRAGQCAV